MLGDGLEESTWGNWPHVSAGAKPLWGCDGSPCAKVSMPEACAGTLASCQRARVAGDSIRWIAISEYSALTDFGSYGETLNVLTIGQTPKRNC